MTSKAQLSALADELGNVRNEIATLKDRERDIREKLIKAGVTSIEGETFRATVVEQIRTLIDWKAVAAKLNPSRQLVTAHTTNKEVISIRMSTRTGVAS